MWEKRGELLSHLRTQIEVQQAALGLDDFQLGARIGISRLTLSRLKKGDADWTPEMLVRVADALERDVSIRLTRRPARKAKA